ncbi:MAG TPA: addiction module protein [Roseiarcus sp.]|nr:addiction module protein [Roseiarcus sp.]
MTSAFDIARLTPQERLDLIGELWDSLSAEDVRLSPAQDAELERRLRTFEADAQAAIPWEDIDAEFARRRR